ncbi:MAG TPA: hypothetical protein VNV41_07205 [Candidatus Acidoferrales bacterium]|jgi:hypothetical protein|nr:hypothetical protein [Candidatus Acidoferrales bacterium]
MTILRTDLQGVPRLDEHDTDTLGPIGPVLATKAAEAFVRDNEAEFTPYNTSDNIELFFGWCTANIVPPSLRNLSIAFRELVKGGQMKQREDYEDQVTIHVAQAFAAAHPELEQYFESSKNCDIVEEYRIRRGLPLTVDGLYEAFSDCMTQRRIIPGETGFPTFRKQNEAEKFLAKEERKKAEALSPAGQKPSKELKQAYQASLRGSPAQTADYQKRLTEARVKIGNENPSLDIYSREFARLVSAELSKN